jgi:hypothetical protein
MHRINSKPTAETAALMEQINSWAAFPATQPPGKFHVVDYRDKILRTHLDLRKLARDLGTP